MISASRAELEKVRMKAAVDLRNRVRQCDIVVKYDVTPTTVSKWAKKFRAGGKQALRSKKTPGRPSRLSVEQLVQLVDVLDRSIHQRSAQQISDLIDATYGFRYHPFGIPRLLERARKVKEMKSS